MRHPPFVHPLALPVVLLGYLLLAPLPAQAQEAAEPPADAEVPAKADPPGLTRLAKDYDVWVDLKRKRVVVDGKICLREGQLEMFACPRRTKEHESIVAVDSDAQSIHAGLLAVGAEPGRPVQYDPEYSPAEGTTVDVMVLWRDRDGNRQQAPAQDWIRNVKTGETMQYTWVFVGSGFWVDEDSGQQHYFANAGDLICVSNFPTAMMDLPVKSPQDNANLLYEAFTERIPTMGTKVRLVLIPRLDDEPPAPSEEP